MRIRLDGMSIAGIAVLLMFGLSLFRGFSSRVAADAAPVPDAPGAVEATATAAAAQQATQAAAPPEAPPAVDVAWNEATALPYDEYFLTQGLHGESYGHLAVDIAAGNGSVIKSIINGIVAATGYDQWGNTFIQIENDFFSVLYLHGAYSVAQGETVTAGQPIGTESNIGYTLDIYGNVCGYTGRDCGYHTHLNVFDKRLGINIDPLTLIPSAYP